MTTPICEHLDEYGAQFARTEATYRQCMDVLDRILAQGPLPALVRARTAAQQTEQRGAQRRFARIDHDQTLPLMAARAPPPRTTAAEEFRRYSHT